MNANTATEARARRISYRTRGHSQGPITRLVSPSDVGQLIKPFVFLDYFDIEPKRMPALGFHPHSGIAKHTVAWLALHKGKLATPEIVDTGELVVFEPSNAALEFEALQDAGFVLGSAVKHPHDLFLGNYSVHTSQEALDKGEANIREIGKRLRAEGRL